MLIAQPMKSRLLYLLTGFTSLVMPLFLPASTSPQVEQFGQMAIHRSAHKATALSDGRVLITGGRIKIGYEATLILLRSGARVVMTSRFPVDAAKRFEAPLSQLLMTTVGRRSLRG